MAPSKVAFLASYEIELLARYPWAKTDKLDKYMASVRSTIASEFAARTWHPEGPACDAAWKAIGGKGRPSLTKLHSLPYA